MVSTGNRSSLYAYVIGILHRCFEDSGFTMRRSCNPRRGSACPGHYGTGPACWPVEIMYVVLPLLPWLVLICVRMTRKDCCMRKKIVVMMYLQKMREWVESNTICRIGNSLFSLCVRVRTLRATSHIFRLGVLGNCFRIIGINPLVRIQGGFASPYARLVERTYLSGSVCIQSVNGFAGRLWYRWPWPVVEVNVLHLSRIIPISSRTYELAELLLV